MEEEAFEALLEQAYDGETAEVLAAVAGGQALPAKADQVKGIKHVHHASVAGQLGPVQALCAEGGGQGRVGRSRPGCWGHRGPQCLR